MLVLIHQVVNGVAVVDHILHLKPREHGGAGTQRADEQQHQAGSAEGVTLSRQSDEIEYDCDRKQGEGERHEHRVNAGPVVAEHRSSGKGA